MQNRFKDWGDVRIFLAVMREGSTLAASRLLDINQTTVSRRIDVLEQALGLKLFEKTTRGACATDTAQQLLPYAEAIEKSAADFANVARFERERTAPPIRITAFDNAMIGNVSQVVADFVEGNPGASFEFITAERMLDLVKGEADVAVRMTPAIKDDRLIARKLGQTQWTYYASKAYAEKNGTPDAFTEDMSPHRVALLSHITTRRSNVLRCQSGDDLTTAVRTGVAIGPLPTFAGDAHPDLVRCFDPPDGSDLTIWLVVSPDAHKRSEVRKFTAFAAPRISRNLRRL